LGSEVCLGQNIHSQNNNNMELPFAVESPAAGSGADNNRAGMNDSLQHSEEGSLVTASSQGSFMNSSSNANLNIQDHCGPFIPATTPPQDILLTSPPHHTQSRQQQIQQHQQGQLVLIPANEEQQPTVGMNDGGYGDLENDFTYVNVTEIDADEDGLLLEGADLSLQPQDQVRGDVLTVLLGEMQQSECNSLLNGTESANEMALKASEAKQRGDLLSALDHHAQAAKLYKDVAVAIRDKNSPLASSLLLLSQTQAKSAIALKSIVKLKPSELRQILPPSSRDSSENTHSSAPISQKERLRAVVRGALSSRHPHEEDLSDSQFLGRTEMETTGKSAAMSTKTRSSITLSDNKAGRKSSKTDDARNDYEGTLLTEEHDLLNIDSSNPVDEMMELERELRDMDMALELGNSISSLDVRIQNRMKNSMIGDGSFMVVPPGSSSYMSSSIWGSSPGYNNNSRQPVVSSVNQQGTAGVRATKNRVQNILDASVTHTGRPLYQQPQISTAQPISNKNTSGLESSWWGNTNTTSQILTSSVMSLGGGRSGVEGGPASDISNSQQCSGNTKQIMRLMDSLKTLGDENAVLLREIEELEAARQEAKGARETMKRFKLEYGKRFSSLKNALQNFRQENQSGKNTSNGPVNTSDFMKNATLLDQLQQKDHVIQKLTRDLKKEKEESKKKDSALRKYESFYRDIKARSAQKAAQRQTQQQRQNPKPVRSVPSRPSTQR